MKAIGIRMVQRTRKGFLHANTWIFAVLLAFTLVACQAEAPQEQVQEQTEEHEDAPAEEHAPTGSTVVADNVNAPPSPNAKTFVLTGENFKFTMDGQENPDIRVQQGDLVRIEFSSNQGFHDWVVEEYGATAQVWPGNVTSVEFVADQAGTFEYFCSVGRHRENGMKGNFIVE